MIPALKRRGAAIVKRLPPKAKMAEVGVLLARLSEYILTNTDATMVLVDSWAPTEQQPEQYKATRDVHAFADKARAEAHRKEAVQRVACFGDRTRIVWGDSKMAADTVEDGSLDMVFLDADHSEQGVRDDIAAWLPKVKAGGWIAGHDYANQEPEYDFSGVKRAVDEAFPEGVELDANTTWFKRVD